MRIIGGTRRGLKLAEVGEGDVASFWYFRGPELLAVDAMNDSRAYMVGKRLIEMGKSPAPEVIATAADLKALLKG